MRDRWDIFCRVVDNFGDIGVCWRLARQLAGEHGKAVRLWVDDLDSLRPLCPWIDPVLDEQIFDGVDVVRWPRAFPNTAAADVVIEAFACEPPPTYLEAMRHRQKRPIWINVEYLSAEQWVEGCHGLSSRHPVLGLEKYFFFPGFTPPTGGLLRERDLLARRDAFIAALPPSERLETSLFCYEAAPVGGLIEAWIADGRPLRCRVPPGQPFSAIATQLGGSGPWEFGPVRIEPVPFLPQTDYDCLLWSCDVNFVRGEDSFVRAQWAGRPFVWQAYPQNEEAHLEKLDAFLQHYLGGMEPDGGSRAAGNLFEAWNRGGSLTEAWTAYRTQLPVISTHGRRWAERLAKMGSLAENLVKFCDAKL